MIRFLADENFDNKIIRGILRRVSTIDVEFIRAQDTKLEGEPDPQVLDYALENDLILLTHDVNTMRGFYYERVKEGKSVPTIFLVHGDKSIGDVIDSLELIILASEPEDWTGQLHYIPL